MKRSIRFSISLATPSRHGENLALLLQNYDNIDFQGLAPIVRDLCLYPFRLRAGSPEYGAELSQLLYPGSAE